MGLLETALANFIAVPILVQVAASVAVGFAIAFPATVMYGLTQNREVEEASRSLDGDIASREGDLDAYTARLPGEDARDQYVDVPFNTKNAFAGLTAGMAQIGSNLYHGTKRTRARAGRAAREAGAGGVVNLISPRHRREQLQRAGFVASPVPLTNRPGRQ